MAVDAKLNANSADGATKDLKTIENKIVLRLKRILTEQSAEDIDSNKVAIYVCVLFVLYVLFFSSLCENF